MRVKHSQEEKDVSSDLGNTIAAAHQSGKALNSSEFIILHIEQIFTKGYDLQQCFSTGGPQTPSVPWWNCNGSLIIKSIVLF